MSEPSSQRPEGSTLDPEEFLHEARRRAPGPRASLRENLTPEHKRWIIAVLTLVLFTHTMDFMVLMPLGPRLMDLFQISPQQFSGLVSIYSLMAAVFGFFGALVFDRLDRKHALIGSYIGFLLGTFACAWAPTYSVLLVARGLAGAFGGLLAGISFAIIGDLFTLHERGAATGQLMTSFSLAAIVGVPSGLLLSNRLGWHAPFFAIGVFGLVCLVIMLRVIPNVTAHLRSHYSGIFSGLSENLGDSNSRRALLTTLMMVLSQFVVIPFISPYLVGNTGFAEANLAYVYLLGGLLTAFSGPWVGRWCDRSSPRRIFTYTGLLFLIPMFAVTHLGHQSMALVLTATTAFFVLSNARMVPAMTIIQSSIPPSRRGGFMSLNSSIQQLGAASASFLGGWVISKPLGDVSIQGFEDTAYLSIAFGIGAYLFGRSVKVVS